MLQNKPGIKRGQAAAHAMTQRHKTCEGKTAEAETGKGSKSKILRHLDCDVKELERSLKSVGACE